MAEHSSATQAASGHGLSENGSSRNRLLLRWLRGAWLGWIALIALLFVMTQVVTPRVSQFMDYWYDMPAGSPYAEQAEVLRQSREQQVIRRAWMIGAAPVAVLFLLPLFFAVFSREKAAGEEVAGLSDGFDYTPDTTQKYSVEKTIIRSAEQTLVRGSAVPAGGAKSSLEGDGAVYIGHGGRYRIDRLLASGGMGSVHKGYDKTLQRDVAIKELDVNLSNDQEQTDRFRQEALALAGLAHPYIVPVYDLLEDNARFWIVMELLPGGDLEDRIDTNPPTVKIAANIVRAIAEGLAFAHNKGIIHRDIKPMNILFNADGIPKLVDFGIAKLVQSQKSVVQTREGLSLGSPTYMSPEQVKGKKDIDKRADIYALGVTLYKMLTGVAPFTGDAEEVMRQHMFETPVPPSELNNLVSAEFDAIVLKMLAKNPDDRYQSLEEFVVALDDMKRS
ncbi:MAG TPA: serine/threonine-protein kinase [Pseudomonadales bacterium]|nr:serine/threonine-protein kinase [Pseudomonadales bacterium]